MSNSVVDFEAEIDDALQNHISPILFENVPATNICGVSVHTSYTIIFDDKWEKATLFPGDNYKMATAKHRKRIEAILEKKGIEINFDH